MVAERIAPDQAAPLTQPPIAPSYYGYTPASLRAYRRAQKHTRARLRGGSIVVLALVIVGIVGRPNIAWPIGVGTKAGAPLTSATAHGTSPSALAAPTPAPTPTAAPIVLHPADLAALLSAVHPATPTPVPLPPLPGKYPESAKLQALVHGQTGTYTLCVFDIASQQWYGFGATARLTATSIKKLAILAALYHDAGESRMALNRVVTTTPADVQPNGPGSIRYDPVGSSYTVRTLAKLMIEQSDTTASFLLAREVGIQRVQQLLTDWGVTSTAIANDTTTALDTTRLLELLYRGQIAPPPLTAQMLDFLTHTDSQDRIPALLPPDLRIAHEVGSHVGALDDAGIVYLARRPYIIALMSQGADDKAALSIEQQLSKAVFDFQNALPVAPG